MISVPDPCLPVDMVDTIQVPSLGKEVHLRGTGDYVRCRGLVKKLLNQTAPCVKEPCSMDGVFQPDINFYKSQFYGFSEFYYTMEDLLKIGGKYNPSKFQAAAQVSLWWEISSSFYQRYIMPM